MGTEDKVFKDGFEKENFLQQQKDRHTRGGASFAVPDKYLTLSLNFESTSLGLSNKMD